MERFGFSEAAPEEFQLAETAFSAGEAAYESDNTLARASYLEASAGYRQVIRRGMQSFVVNYRQEIESNKSRGQDVRAEVAQRELFEQAQADWDEAERLYEAEELDQAADYFQRARDGFLQAQERAAAQREEALEALRALDSNLESTEEEILGFEQEIQGGAE